MQGMRWKLYRRSAGNGTVLGSHTGTDAAWGHGDWQVGPQFDGKIPSAAGWAARIVASSNVVQREVPHS
jgi:hypothetical protein